MLHFIVGAAMSGKTRYLQLLAARLIGEGKSVVYIVPEQFVFSTEKMLLNQAGPGFVRGAQVLSLSRMA